MLVAIVLFSGLIRATISVEREWIGYDEANYLMIGRNAGAGLGYVQTALGQYQSKFHLLSIFAPAAVSKIVGDEFLASKLIFVGSGMLTVALVAGLGGALFGPSTGLIAGAMTAVAPALTTLTAPSISHSLFNPFFIAGLWLAWNAALKGRLSLAFAAGLSIGVCWWARADGLLVAPMVAFFLFTGGWLLTRTRSSWANTAAFSATFGLGYWLYSLAVKTVSSGGATPHGPLFDFLLYPPQCIPSRDLATYGSFLELALGEPRCIAQKIVENIDQLPATLFTWTGFPLVLLPLLGAAIVGRPKWNRGCVATYGLLALAVLPLAAYLPFYYETRYVSCYAAVAFIACAQGALVIGDRLRPRWGRVGRLAPALLTVAFLLATTAVHIPRLSGMAGLEYVEAGNWIDQHAEKDAIVWTSQSEVAFFARRPWTYPPSQASVVDHIAGLGSQLLLVVDERNFSKKNPTWARLVGAERPDWLEVVFRSSVPGPSLTIYQVSPSILLEAASSNRRRSSADRPPGA